MFKKGCRPPYTGAMRPLRKLLEGPACSAAPAWRVTDDGLLEKETYPFVYGSDCRGTSLFYPVVNGRTLRQPQIPVTLPTYDEAVGRNGLRHEDWNTYLLRRLNPASLNVLTIHAEVEGMACARLFERETSISTGSIVRGFVAGREGWVTPGVTIVADEAFVGGVCWYYGRDDVRILLNSGELNYGLRYADSARYRLDLKEFNDMAASRERQNPVVLIADARFYERNETELTEPQAVRREGRFVMAQYWGHVPSTLKPNMCSD